ncbi:MAG: cell wall metabolism sensor histidine kinase WalK [Elusimicrobia bacterium]|nr:cell wall metabolism sensor histidine kinase WalK [Elusimicrobiota bacterium]
MKNHIHYKITAVFGIIIGIVFMGVYFYLNAGLSEAAYLRIKGNLSKQTSLSKSFIEQSADKENIKAIVDNIAKNLGVRVTIIGLDGFVKGDSELNGQQLSEVENHIQRPEVQQALKSKIGENRRLSTTVKKEMLYMAALYGKEKSLGIIRLAIPLMEMEVISDNLKKMLSVAFFIAFILALLISFFVSILISRPVREMSLMAKSIAEGDFSKRILISSNDEIGDLSKAFNFMAEQIKSRMRDVIAGKSKLEAVLLSMFEGIMVVDNNGGVLLINQTLRKLFDVKQNFEGKTALELIRNIEIQEITDAVLKLKEGFKSKEISVMVSEEKILLINAVPIMKADICDGAVLVFHDITDLRRLEKIRRDFVANVSHELRTPVCSIKGYSETLLEGALHDKNNAEDFLKIIYSDCERLAKLIDDILDLAKIESDNLALNLKSCDVKEIVQRIVSGMSMRIKAKSLDINVKIPDQIAGIMADENRIAQVLVNLIENALKYTKRGEISISALEEGDFLRINVTDTGIGIPEKDIPRLFERFYRVDKARSKELGGTGLGLSIVKHIVYAHNGKVSVQSAQGKGSVFSFTVPKA